MDSKPLGKSNWFVGLTKHYGSAFEVANHFALQGSRNLEISALGKQGLMIVDLKEKTSEKDQKFFADQFGIHFDHKLFLNELPEKVVKAYLNLENAKCKNFLLFLQFNFLGDAFRLAQQALVKDFEIVELRFIRSSSNVTHLILTGTDEKEAKIFAVENEGFSSQLVLNPTDEIKKYFEIFPY